ncbi:heme-binding protein [Herbiconiux sp.]|uniref:heme-binding protein n=1 Tax=Herbiconiux sp. TaxID=1871186 RepID=UPI0025C1C149|nr:heme-binding protein [Herbiconiux sp.]
MSAAGTARETALAENPFTVASLEAAEPFDVSSFTNADAFELGVIASMLIRERGLDLAVEIVLGDDTVFRSKFGATDTGNDPWLAGKAAVVRHFSQPSLLVRRRFEEAGTPFETLTDPALDHATMKAHGGSIPLFVQGALAGTITTSGEPDTVDHETSADALAAYARAHTRS